MGKNGTASAEWKETREEGWQQASINVVDVVYVKSVCFRFIFTCDADTELFHENNLKFPCGKRAVSFCRHGAT